MTTTTANIYELAEKLNAKVWEKGDMKRIYLNDEGYNTKKMSTKTFIWQDETGEFKVSVRIECPSQPWNWIKSQEQEVREWVLKRIDRAINGETDEDEAREAYNDIKEDYLKDENLEWRNNNIFLAMTTEMQMAYTVDEGKMEAVDQLLRDIPQGETIIFCRFIVAQEECRKRWPQATVLSMQKESLGLNLQQYRHTIFFDRVWDYALLLQASRRTYRTGQEQDCHYYELTGNVGLERMMKENITKKVSMSEYLKKVTKEELRKAL